MNKDEIMKAAANLFNNGMGSGAQLYMPSLEHLNQLRADDGLEPLTRGEVPENIHFVNEMELDDG